MFFGSQITSSAECKKVVSDIFDEIEFLIEYETLGLYEHFALFSKFVALLFFQNIKQNVFKNALTTLLH